MTVTYDNNATLRLQARGDITESPEMAFMKILV
jgi:hypothetical protein